MAVYGSRAPYACDPGSSRGRLYDEPRSLTRTDFRRDCDRIIHSTAFRRLAYKTQVFVHHEGDHYRTRLTHTLEVVQIARALARALSLDEDLAEACALGHDLGHPPFGHSGERALDRCLADAGGFDHNAQTLCVVTRLERRYAGFDGLNLTWETLEGLIKHNGPLIGVGGRPGPALPAVIADYCMRADIDLACFPSAEAQAGAIADDIAYDAHDIDDGLRAQLFSIAELAAVPLIGDLIGEIDAGHPDLETARRSHELVRRLIARMIEDVITQSRLLIGCFAPFSADAIRRAGASLIAFSPAMAAADRAIKAFLFPRMYRHPRIMRIMGEAESVVCDLFARYLADPPQLPWTLPQDGPARFRQVADYIAGMTDRFALSEHTRLFDLTPELR